MTISDRLDIPELPVAFMNDDHAHAARQWEEMVAALDEYPDQPERLLAASEVFLEHSREHFQREELAMQATGFPPYPMHKQEHDRVLAWLGELVGLIRSGAEVERLRGLIQQDVAAWLVQHVRTMDQVTARWIASH